MHEPSDDMPASSCLPCSSCMPADCPWSATGLCEKLRNTLPAGLPCVQEREGGRELRREGGKEGGREGGREEGREGGSVRVRIH
jgi:hypothetical protein